jgi:hypothetical protein
MKRSGTIIGLAAAAAAGLLTAGFVQRATAGCTGCGGGCGECIPACRGTWSEKTSAKPVYSMSCEYACVRGSDPWHAPPPECRCHPPCGTVIVKKRFYKAEGPEHVERVPKYEVALVHAEPPCATCDHSSPSGGRPAQGGWWRPLDFLSRCAAWW